MVFEPFSTYISVAKTLRAHAHYNNTCAVIKSSGAIVRSASEYFAQLSAWPQ